MVFNAAFTYLKINKEKKINWKLKKKKLRKWKKNIIFELGFIFHTDLKTIWPFLQKKQRQQQLSDFPSDKLVDGNLR